jgi:anti-sigma-K factor RskA
MPDVINNQDLHELAAEFVLGTLDSDERARANERLNSDDQFRDLVRTWERRLGELHLMVEPVEPPAPIWDRIRGNIAGIAPTSDAEPSGAPPESPPTTEPELTFDALEAELRQAGIAGGDPTANQSPESVTPAAVIPADSPPLVTPAAVDPAVDTPLPIEQTTGGSPVDQASRESQSLRRWRLAAVVTTVVAAALAGLIAAWRYVPERLPPQLRAANVLNMRVAAPPPSRVRPTPPPGSQFDE